MEFHANKGKNIYIEVGDKRYARHAIATHFVRVGENYIDLVRRYVLPVYRAGDIVASSEKVIALCQGRIVTEDEVRPTHWARLLSRFVHQTAAGPGMGLPAKMQFAINLCGLGKVLRAAACAGVHKLMGVRGTFYKMLGAEVSGLDGFYGKEIPEYAHIGIRIPRDPDGVCDEIYARTGVVMMIVDANDLNVELLGKCKQLADRSNDELLALVADNPAGQDRQLTPFVLIRGGG